MYVVVYQDGTTSLDRCRPNNLRDVVEVVPEVVVANPVVVHDGVVGLVVGVHGDVVEMTVLGVLTGGLDVQGGIGLTVESLFLFMRSDLVYKK